MWKRKSKATQPAEDEHRENEEKLPKQTRSTRKLIKRVIYIVLILGLSLSFLSYLTWRPENRIRNYTLAKQTEAYSIVDVNVDGQMIHMLRNDEIVQIERYDAGLAEKYICVFESGYQALIKPMEEWHYFERIVPRWDVAKLPRFRNNRLGRWVVNF